MKKLILLTLITPLLLAGCLLDYDDYVKIVFVTNDADETGNISSQTHIVGSEATLPGMDDMIRYKHTFKGWSVTGNGTTNYEEGTTIDIDSSFTTHAVNNVITLYAKWEPITDPSSDGDKVFLWYNNKKLVANESDGVPGGDDEDPVTCTWHEAMAEDGETHEDKKWYVPNVNVMRKMVDKLETNNNDDNGKLEASTSYWTRDTYALDDDQALVIDSSSNNKDTAFKSNTHSVRFYTIEDVGP